MYDDYDDIPDDIMSMSLDELRAAQDRLRPQYAYGRQVRKWSPEDYRASALDFMAINAGQRARNPHPLTEQRLQSRSEWSTVDLVRDILAATYGPHVIDWDDRQILAQGVGTHVYGDLYGTTANQRVLTRTPRLLQKVFAFCQPIELNDYRPTETGAFELEAGIDTASDLVREWQNLTPVATSEAIALRSSPVRIRFPEPFVVNDDMGAINAVVDAITIAAAQNELAAAFGVLNANGTLKDGESLFRAGDNLVSGQTKAVTAINAGIETLRGQTINGQTTDAEPYAVLVPSADEGAGRQIMTELFGGRDALHLIGSSYLDAGAWYVVAQPGVWPTLTRATLRGTDGALLRFSSAYPNEREGSRDVILSALHTYRYQAINRTGIVRVEVS